MLWDLAGQKRLTEISIYKKKGFASGLAFSPDGTSLAAGCAGGGVENRGTWPVESG